MKADRPRLDGAATSAIMIPTGTERRSRRSKGSSEARTDAFQAMSSGSTSILTLVCAAKCAQACDPSLPLAPLGPGLVGLDAGAAWSRLAPSVWAASVPRLCYA